MLQRIQNRKGFTLVELMIVVAIIGILAAIAIPNFLNFRLKAKNAEAKSNLGAIRSCEVAYFAEWNFYVANQQTFVPDDRGAGTGNDAKIAWMPGALGSKFSILGFTPEGSVYFSYAIHPNVNYPVSNEGFDVRANADLDADGDLSEFWVSQVSTDIVHAGGAF